MTIPRSIAFADGENLVMRFQAMVEAGAIPKEDVVHQRDCFVWHEAVTRLSMFDFIRVNYYNSTTGDVPRVEALKDQISEVGIFLFHRRPGRQRQSRSTRLP